MGRGNLMSHGKPGSRRVHNICSKNWSYMWPRIFPESHKSQKQTACIFILKHPCGRSGQILSVCLSSLRDQHEVLCRKCHQKMENGELGPSPAFEGLCKVLLELWSWEASFNHHGTREVRTVNPERPPDLLYLQSKTLKSELFFYLCIDFVFADMFKIMLPVNLFV